jgi:hypothetical protein
MRELYWVQESSPGFVNGKTGSVTSTGQHKPLFDGAMVSVVGLRRDQKTWYWREKSIDVGPPSKRHA